MFKTHNDTEIEIAGTSLLGEIDVRFSQLVKTFGKPSESYDGEKTDAEWHLLFPGGVVATIYNWKDGKNYNGPDGEDVDDIRTWHVGGKEYEALEYVQEALGIE